MSFCLQCSAEIELSEAAVACSRCGSSYDTVRGERLLAFAEFVFVAARHTIPACRDLQPEDRYRQFTPDLTEAGKWVALVVLEGVVGGLGADAVKALVRKFRSAFASDPAKQQIKDDLADDVDVLREQVLLFFREFPQLSPQARAAVIDELIVHSLQRRNQLAALSVGDMANPTCESTDAAPVQLPEYQERCRAAQQDALDLLNNPPFEELRGLWSGFTYYEMIESDDHDRGA